LELEQRFDDVGLRLQILEARGHLDAGFAKDLAAAGLRAEVLELRIEPIQRNTQEHRQLTPERRRVEHRQVGL
jgi:hypothetical protein